MGPRTGLATLATMLLLCASPASAFVYFGGTNMGRANLDGTGVNASFLPFADADTNIATDGEHLFWGNGGSGISRSNLDGSDLSENFISLAHTPEAVAVADGDIYWTEDGATPTAGTIGRASLDGTNVTQTLITGQDNPLAIAADALHIYWTTNSGGISRAATDGSTVEPNFLPLATTGNPQGLALDGEHLYWSSFAHGVGRANLDGTAPNTTFVATATRPTLVAVDASHIYWTAGTAIGRANIDGSAVNNSFITGVGPPFALGVDSGPAGTASPSSQALSFATQALDTLGPPQPVTIANNGHGELQLGRARVTGTDPDDFLISSDGCSDTLLDPGSSCSVHVRFGPTATGARAATLTLGSLSIGLAGTGGALPQGPPGKIELVTCRTVTVKVKRHHKVKRVKRKRCTTKLVSGPVKFTTG